jgi:drug/metabolite transporter (DMT)-like permease
MHWLSVLLYMTSSFMIVIFNKIILTQYHFPSVPFLMLCQSIVSSVFFWTKLKQKANRELILVCLLNVANVFFGLNAAGTLNIAMFTALRRISIMMTLIAQWWFLSKKSTKPVVITVGVMVFGSFVAASDDLTFDLLGYTFAMTNNLLTAAAQIASKYAFDKGWQKETILFYSSLTSVVLSGMKCYDFDLNTFHDWDQTGFQMAFVFSIALGILLNFGASWVIEKNDALTLAVAGSTKSAVMGLMVCFGLFDPTYMFTWVNFIGLQISTIGSFAYVYYTKKKPKYTLIPEEKQMTSV